MKTAQQVFDHTVRHLFTQRERATFPGNMCSYRTTDGLQCAVGCHINPNFYDPEMEGAGIRHLFSKYPDAMSDAGLHEDSHYWLLHRLQRVHDEEPPRYWHEQLHLLADAEELDTTVLDAQEPIL